MIKVQIIDDHRVVADGFRKIIDESGIATVTGMAHTAAQGWEMLIRDTPDVLLLDVGLPDGNGMELCPQIKARYPSVNILMVTTYAEYTIISHVLNNGASGYILKTADSEEILEGIKTVADGKRFLSEEVDLLMRKTDPAHFSLTRTEYTLLRHLVDGNTSAEIAEKMNLGYETIRTYRKNLLYKFNAHNTVALIRMAQERGLC
ncbi:MAG: response regulator transcription factor [Tannerella sp.]|jgi:DNA-binding NarL/FixJ family response regulator|nr:response regulator transcription factor [Tannerella sp.]